MIDTKEDDVLIRNLAGANMWPASVLEKYHPRDDFKGDQFTFPFVGVFSSFLDERLHDPSNPVTLDDGMLQVVGSNLNSVPMMLAHEVTRTLFNTAPTGRGPMSREEMLNFETELMVLFNDKTEQVCAAKNEFKIARPAAYQGEFDGADGIKSYGYPSLATSLLCEMGKYVEERFSFTDEDKLMWFDTLYLAAMLSAMAGTNSIGNIIKTFEDEGLIT